MQKSFLLCTSTFFCSVGRVALKELRRQDAIDPNVADLGGEHFNVSSLWHGVVRTPITIDLSGNLCVLRGLADN